MAVNTRLLVVKRISKPGIRIFFGLMNEQTTILSLTRMMSHVILSLIKTDIVTIVVHDKRQCHLMQHVMYNIGSPVP